MKTTYQIFKMTSKEVHVPSQDYYARSYDSQRDDISVLVPSEAFDTPEEAHDHLKNLAETALEDAYTAKHYGGDYIILPVYTI